ncbi:MAG: site-2 protease family protein [Polyangiaceae bacterium]|nr:site-2 protease family protein [Polyangiaceae bacterium]
MSQAVGAPKTRLAWRTNAALLVATIASVLVTGIGNLGVDAPAKAPSEAPSETVGLWTTIGAQYFDALRSPSAIARGVEFAATLLSILVAHELGHYVAARIHKVQASLPYFIPLPILSPFGTMGAVIRMRGTIATRRALLDIGAAGPLAGLLFAIPLYVWGIAHSTVGAVSDDTVWFGESILMKLIHRLVGPPLAEGMDIQLSPAAFGAWGGLFVTMINLFPVGQLDGGHVAYALFGTKQNLYASFVHRSMLVFFFVVVLGHLARDVSARDMSAGMYHLGRHIANSMFWIVWFQMLAILGSLAPSSRAAREQRRPTISIRTRIVSTLSLLMLASLARDHHHPIYLVTFFGGLALCIAMEAKGGSLRQSDLLNHPETTAAPLDTGRKVIAIVTLVMFVLLFMPEPFSM